MARRLAEKYPLARGRIPRIRAALGLDDPAVAQAFERAVGAPLGSIEPDRIDATERLRWIRSGTARRLEELPPFWMAFALALTETIAEGILAIPVAVAGIGPLAGIALLVVLGLVNVVTLAALVEAITRTGQMRYGETYFGRLVREYLGSTGAVAFSTALFLFNVICVLVYLLGFASVLGDATGVGLAWWVALLFAINVVVIRRDSLDATVASALVIGAVNILLIIAICGLGLAHLDADNFGAPDFGGGLVVQAGLLQLVFGVILVAYFGHTSAGNAAKLILRDDMTGRALLGGNVAAMVTVIGLYALGVLAINGAVAPEALIGDTGTSLSPLADVAGPAVLVLGSIYVTLALGIGSIYASLGLTNQVREWLPTSVGDRTGLPRAAASLVVRPGGRMAVSLLPVAAAFVILEALIVAGSADFTAPLALIGTLAIPLLGGVFPMLLLAAARQRGEFVPRPVIGFIGAPAVVVGVSVLYIAAIALHGLVIWQEPIDRGLAILVALGVAALAVRATRRGSFRPRAAVQIRVTGDGTGNAVLEAADAGRPMSIAVEHAGSAPTERVPGAEIILGDAGRLGPIRLHLPDRVSDSLRVWVHRVDAADDSVVWPMEIQLDAAAGGPAVNLDGDGVADIEPGRDRLTIDLVPSAVP